MPDFSYESAVSSLAPCTVAGVDEVGCGAWAGPVVAAAAVLNPSFWPHELLAQIQDSKKLTRLHREAFFMAAIELPPEALQWSVGICELAEIEALNIRGAAHTAMVKALDILPCRPTHVLVDGPHAPKRGTYTYQPIIKGDSLSLSIATASMMAKVVRDRLMVDLARDYPAYGWDSNAGYGTATHIAALEQYGVTPHHRRTYAPIQKILMQN